MAVPTELLSEDVKELKADIRDIRGDINVLKSDVHAIAVGLAELRAEFRVSIGVARWAVGFLGAAVLSGVMAGIWWGDTISSEVKHLVQAVEQQKAAPASKVAAHVLAE